MPHNRYEWNKRRAKWDETKTLFENCDLLDISPLWARDYAHARGLKYKGWKDPKLTRKLKYE